MSELKCCPFCGGEAEMLNYSPTEWLVHCIECDGMVEKWRKTKQEAIEQWNCRTPMSNIVDKLEEKTEFLKDCTKYGNESAEQQEKSYSTMMMYEVADLVDDLIDIVKQEINNGLE